MFNISGIKLSSQQSLSNASEQSMRLSGKFAHCRQLRPACFPMSWNNYEANSNNVLIQTTNAGRNLAVQEDMLWA